jgi:hypothetical protein
MINDIMRSSSVERLRGILQSRYGKGLEVSFLNDSRVVELAGGTFALKEGVLQIPILSHGQFLAVAKIPDAGSLPKSSQEAITEMVRLVLEPAIYSWVLNKSEENKDQHSFHRIGGPQALEEETSSELKDEKSPVVLIISENPHRIPRLALQVHETLNRWAFVNWKDMRDQIKSVHDLRELGAMSILVEDVLMLTPDEKALLDEWIKTSQASTEPALILGSSMDWNRLKEQAVMPSGLLYEAGFHQIEADRLPADRRFCEEALQLLLDKGSAIHNH